jgi:hypothetical protein
MATHVISGNTVSGDLSGTVTNSVVTKINSQNIEAVTSAGDLYVYGGTNINKLPVSSNGFALTVSTGSTLGVNWVNKSTGSTAFSFANYQKTTTATTAINSATYTLISSMTFTGNTEINVGSYIFKFSSSIQETSTAGGTDIDYAIHKNGVIVQHSNRRLVYNSTTASDTLWIPAYTQAFLSVTTGDTVDVRVKTTAQINVAQRSFIANRLQ